MVIKDLLSVKRCLAKADILSKKSALEAVAELIQADFPQLSCEDALQLLIARERLGSTGLGNGVAIPHCRSQKLESAVGVCLTLENPVDFESVDNEPVDIIFAILVPINADEKHLETLALVAEKFNRSDFLSQLRKVETSEDLYSLVTE